MKTTLVYSNFNRALSDLSIAVIEPRSPLHGIKLWKKADIEDRKDLLYAFSKCKDMEDLNFILDMYYPVTGVEVAVVQQQ